jgi:hypothetical protein
MSETEAVIRHYRAILARLNNGEPVRLLVGERFYDCAEIVLLAEAQSDLRARCVADIEARLAGLSTPEPDPAAASAAMPFERNA